MLTQGVHLRTFEIYTYIYIYINLSLSLSEVLYRYIYMVCVPYSKELPH